MSAPEIVNAKITRTRLGNDDHGPTGWLTLQWQSAGQGFGGYALLNRGKPHAVFGLWVMGVIDVVGVSTWEELTGQYVRIRRENGLIVAIGHITDDRWFTPKEAFKALLDEGGAP